MSISKELYKAVNVGTIARYCASGILKLDISEAAATMSKRELDRQIDTISAIYGLGDCILAGYGPKSVQVLWDHARVEDRTLEFIDMRNLLQCLREYAKRKRVAFIFFPSSKIALFDRKPLEMFRSIEYQMPEEMGLFDCCAYDGGFMLVASYLGGYNRIMSPAVYFEQNVLTTGKNSFKNYGVSSSGLLHERGDDSRSLCSSSRTLKAVSADFAANCVRVCSRCFPAGLGARSKM